MGAPIRTCVSCRLKGPQSEFIRVTYGGTGRMAVDLPGERGGRRGPGRGAYVCRRPQCIMRAAKGALKRALGSKEALPASLEAEMLRQLGVAGRDPEGADG